MPKFFVDQTALKEDMIEVVGNNFNHIKNVLRLSVDDEIVINDGQGYDYKCIITTMDQNAIYAQIKERIQSTAEPFTKVTLFQSLIKGEKMEWVIQKAVEIGVFEIVPLLTTRCVVKLEGDKKVAAKIDRWNKIAEAAAKQSGRGVVPVVQQPLKMDEAIKYIEDQNLKGFIPYEKEDESGMRSMLQSQNSERFGILIGPEGGFTEEEVASALAHQIQPITLGKRILRSETASLVALTTILYEMGEMG
ncbi:MAG: 16S rRNA (uracil(1498)-N(3))-methyltransferase [Cellulosilyticaceae bacterium]